MSDAGGYVQTPTGERVGCVIYHGSSDVLYPNIADPSDLTWSFEAARAPRDDGQDPWDALKACNHEPEIGYAYSSYGGGSYWPVHFCRACMVVHFPLSPWFILEGSDAPESWMSVWPKDGEPPIETTATEIGRWLLPEKM